MSIKHSIFHVFCKEKGPQCIPRPEREIVVLSCEA
jgi:hypothetical protein